MWPYSLNFIFCVTYKRTHRGRVLRYTRLDRLSRDKHTSLFDWFTRLKRKLLVWILFVGPYLLNFIFFVTYERAQKIYNVKSLGLLGTNNLVYLTNSSVKKNIQSVWLYSLNFIFCVTHKRTQRGRVLRYTRLDRLSRDKHSSLFDYLQG